MTLFQWWAQQCYIQTSLNSNSSWIEPGYLVCWRASSLILRFLLQEENILTLHKAVITSHFKSLLLSYYDVHFEVYVLSGLEEVQHILGHIYSNVCVTVCVLVYSNVPACSSAQIFIALSFEKKSDHWWFLLHGSSSSLISCIHHGCDW